MGFAELLLIGVVSLLVIGPERLPGAIRTASLWINRFRRSFDEVRAEVQRELHNDEVMQELKESARKLETDAQGAKEALREIATPLEDSAESLKAPLTNLQQTIESTAEDEQQPSPADRDVG